MYVNSMYVTMVTIKDVNYSMYVTMATINMYVNYSCYHGNNKHVIYSMLLPW